MINIRVCEDPGECKRIWEDFWPRQCLFDLWEVRNAFAEGYKRTPYFLVAEEGRDIAGLVALSRVEDSRCFMHFPGETWKGKTWIEQNKIPARSPDIVAELLDSIPGEAHLRYLTPDSAAMGESEIDETGYLFYPGQHGFSFATYLETFPGKSRKKLFKELAALEQHGVSWRYDRASDIGQLFRMNLESFGEDSYFYDHRFLDSMERLTSWLHGKGWLRITTLLLGGEVAAVDIGAVWERTYTVLAGATNPAFPGVAKMINFHHLQWSCEQRMESVDFLCGDFGWKERFRLTPRPLYEMHLHPETIRPTAVTTNELNAYACEY